MRIVVSLAAALIASAFSTASALAAPILDGTGFGLPSATVVYDPGAPMGNFGAPTPFTSGAAYDIFTMQDSTYLYVMVKPNGLGGSSAGTFANLYFGVGPSASSGSTFGIEVVNQIVFTPGVPDNVSDVGQPIYYAVVGTDAIELAIAFQYFNTNPQGLGFTPTNPGDSIILRLSQSYGYSVAGGATYGPNRLGSFTVPAANVPEPSTLVLIGMALLSLFGLGLRRRKEA